MEPPRKVTDSSVVIAADTMHIIPNRFCDPPNLFDEIAILLLANNSIEDPIENRSCLADVVDRSEPEKYARDGKRVGDGWIILRAMEDETGPDRMLYKANAVAALWKIDAATSFFQCRCLTFS